MALPKLNDVPKYELTIPSTDKKVYFRPFLVKEQKVLMMALETQDDKQILKSITDTIEACLEDDINVNTLATFDVEYMFTQIRAKSVGETTDIMISCKNCETNNKINIKLDEIKIEVNKEDQTIELNDTFTVKMRYPKYASMLNQESADTSVTKILYDLVMTCLDELRTEEEIIKFDDEPEREVQSFIESLTTDQFDKLLAFVNGLPSLKHDVEFKCTHCKEDNQLTLQGLADFF
jgi:phage FluMu protein Com